MKYQIDPDRILKVALELEGDIDPSAGATPDQGATPLVGTGEMVLLRLSAASEYLRHLKQQSLSYYKAAADHLKAGRNDASNSCLRISEAYDHANEEFRRLMASSELRQPQENIAHEPTRRTDAR